MKASILIAVVLAVVGTAQLRAASIAVTTTNDSGPGSLRDALASVADGDTIDASGVSGTILLTNGELLVTNSVDIIGPGPDMLAVDGNATNRVFHLSISSNAVVRISSLSINNGAVGPFDYGGGIYNDSGTMTVSNCTFSGNSAGGGGGVYNSGPNMQIVSCTLSNNSGFFFGGGGIDNYGANAQIINCVLNSNVAHSYFCEGGGVHNGGVGETQIINCTLSDNSADAGGGIANDSCAQIINCTLSDNSSETDSSGRPLGEGIANFGSLAIGSTVIKEGIIHEPADGIDIYSRGTVISLGYNLTTQAAGGNDKTGPGGFFNAAGDIRNTDPHLGPLEDNGGPTLTRALLHGSPAINKGKNFGGLTTDQRGVEFVRTFDEPTVRNAKGGDGTDIGAFELQDLRTGPWTAQIAGLQTLVRQLDLNSKVEKQFLGRLRSIQTQASRGNMKQACLQLSVLQQMSQHLLRRGGITQTEAITIATNVTQAMGALGCP